MQKESCFMNHLVQNENKVSPNSYRKEARLFYYSIPLYLAVPLLIWFFFQKLGAEFIWIAFGLGALGWIIALMLRGPISLLVQNLPQKSAMLLVGLSSGPLEEGIRLTLLLLTGTSFSWALSIGQGWAAIEVLFTIINGLILVKIVQKNDEKSLEVKKILESQGTSRLSPFWGLSERLFASLFHIGATLLIAYSPSLTFSILFVHSAFNLGAVWISRRSMFFAQLFVAIVGLLVLVVGLVQFKNN
jgi:hypothetical protein